MAWKETRVPLPMNSPSPSAHMNVDTDNPHAPSALGWSRSSTGETQQHARLRASSSATSMILLQCPQQIFESYHRREIDNHNLSLRLELLCFTHN